MRSKNLRTSSQVQQAYDQNNSNYDIIRYGTPGGQYVDKKEKEFVAQLVKGFAVLEVGTATGRFVASLVQRGEEYTGIDLSQKMLRTTFGRTNRSAALIQMDASQLGFRSYFDCILCFRTFHFLQKPVETLKEMLGALKPGGRCLVTFETDNFLRRLLLFGEVWTSEQYYYKTSDVEEMFLTAGFDVIKGGVVMRVPVTLFRRCPRSLLWILRRLERLWPWAMHEYVIGMKREKIGLPF